MATTKYTIQHLRCKNDTNGNPRRIWARYDTDGNAEYADEGYRGFPKAWGVRNQYAELPSVEITASDYRHILKSADPS